MSRLPKAAAVYLSPTSTLRIRLHVKPNASVSRIISISPDRVGIAISDPARGGEANKGVVGFICQVLGYRRSDAAIVAGGKSRDKVLAIEGVIRKDAGEKERGEIVSGILEKLRGACQK